MSYRKFERVTDYSSMVDNCVFDWARSLVGELRLNNFAEMCNFSITHNLRRRIENLCDAGILERSYRKDDTGRWVNFYKPSESYRQTVRQPEVPF
jgi:predicted transcriptional regulator